MQQLKTEITIQIPETHALVTKVEYEQLKEQADEVWVRGLNWLVAQTNKGDKQALREMLYAHREELEPNLVDYPSTNKSAWLFNAQPMKIWLRGNFGKVMS